MHQLPKFAQARQASWPVFHPSLTTTLRILSISQYSDTVDLLLSSEPTNDRSSTVKPPAVLTAVLVPIGLLVAAILGYETVTGKRSPLARRVSSTARALGPAKVRLYSGGWLLFVMGMLGLGAGSAELLPVWLAAAGSLTSVMGMVLVLLSYRQPDPPSG